MSAAPFFRMTDDSLVDSPTGRYWFHGMPLPNGEAIRSCHTDNHVQAKLWQGLEIEPGSLAGKAVLDIGANDGYFTIAAVKAGSSDVTAIGLTNPGHGGYPQNIRYASEAWGVRPRVLVGDFRDYPLVPRYDMILFMGVLYHLTDAYRGMLRAHDLLADGGVVYLETQMTAIESALPIFESASDVYPTTARRYGELGHVPGECNYLFPNDAAVRNLAQMTGFDIVRLPASLYTATNPTRGVYRLSAAT